MTSETIYNKVKCEQCDKEFAPRGLFTHLMRVHGTDEQKSIYVQGICKDPNNTKNKIEYRDRLIAYNDSPTKCKQCDSVISYNKRENKFCDTSCAATYNNTNRSPTAKKPGPAKKLKEPKLLFSRLRKCICKHCGIMWYGRREVRICDVHRKLYRDGRTPFSFTFNLADHPLLFDLTIIKIHGMRSATNIHGVVRDHRVSICDAIINGYDPYYIRHPVNCELMLASDNSKKYFKSSITYNQLIEMADKYEKK